MDVLSKVVVVVAAAAEALVYFPFYPTWHSDFRNKTQYSIMLHINLKYDSNDQSFMQDVKHRRRM